MGVIRPLRKFVFLAAWLYGASQGVSSGQTRVVPQLKEDIAVGIVKDVREFHQGGCELLRTTDKYASERYVFLSNFEGSAVMNLNGRDTKLMLIRETKAKGDLKERDRSSAWYRAGAVEVRVDYTVSGFCPPDHESCEVIYYNATVVVSRQGVQKTVLAHGLCGS